VESRVGVGLALGLCSAEQPERLRQANTAAVTRALLPISKW
jgi:hypothetical protein